MARYTIIKYGKVENIAESSATFAASQGWLLSGSEAHGDLWDGTNFTKPPLPPLDRVAAANEIDAAVMAIYTKPMILAEEYKGREKAAADYKAAGYAGVVPKRLAGFATPAGLTPAAAADTVLAFAEQLRGAMDSLSDLRMRKCEVQSATTENKARAAHTAIMAQIATIAASLE